MRNRACEYADYAHATAGDIKASSGERGIILLSAYPRQCRYRHCRGFWSQGDGACYEGRYSHASGAARALRAHAPKDTELHRIVDTLQHAQRRNFWQLHATFRRIGRYSHANSMEIDVERDSPTWQPIADDTEDVVIEALRDLAHWLYRQLQDAYEAETSDNAVDEALTINEWTFTADGKRFG